MLKAKDPKTYFEQVALEIVKKIAKEEMPDGETSGAEATVESPAKKRSTSPRLRRARVAAP